MNTHKSQLGFVQQMESWLEFAHQNYKEKKYVGGSTVNPRWNSPSRKPMKPGLNVWKLYNDWVIVRFSEPTKSNGGTWQNTYYDPVYLHFTDAAPEFKLMLAFFEDIDTGWWVDE
jgi:hypothetical protein